jgi:hypothetical protein
LITPVGGIELFQDLGWGILAVHDVAIIALQIAGAVPEKVGQFLAAVFVVGQQQLASRIEPVKPFVIPACAWQIIICLSGVSV